MNPKLTEAQREVLNELSGYRDRGQRGARPMDVSGSLGRKAAKVLQQLCRKGLAESYNWAGPGERGSCRYWITARGLAALSPEATA